mmetsp:Transcript_35125/g.73161  ORF Transcript_35125/g.73161 Transcript_35125/m.73161 type:complete len:454 (-) Transcript_35125:111-1472(-)
MLERRWVGLSLDSINGVQVLGFFKAVVTTVHVGFQSLSDDMVVNFNGKVAVFLAVNFTDIDQETHGRLLDVMLIITELVLDSIQTQTIRNKYRETRVTNEFVMFIHNTLVTDSEDLGNFSSDTHTDSHGFTVKQWADSLGVERQMLDGMGNGMTVLRDHFIEVRFVVVNQSRNLVVNAVTADFFEIHGVAKSLVKVFTEGSHHVLGHFSGLAQGMLHGLGDTVEDVTLGQSLEDFGIDDNVGGRVVRSQQVLSKLMVDSLLEVNGSIGHSHHGSGNVDQSNSAVKGRSQETTQVIDDTSSERNNASVLGDSVGKDLITAAREDSQGLVTLSAGVSGFINGIGRNHNLVRFHTSIVESLQDLFAVDLVDDFIDNEVVLGLMALFRNVFLGALFQVADSTVFDDNVRVQHLSRSVEAISVDIVFINFSSNYLGLSEAVSALRFVHGGRGHGWIIL